MCFGFTCQQLFLNQEGFGFECDNDKHWATLAGYAMTTTTRIDMDIHTVRVLEKSEFSEYV
jgi:hypothetical protein